MTLVNVENKRLYRETGDRSQETGDRRQKSEV